MLTIGTDLNLTDYNDIQLLVTTILVSTALGGLIAGPLADNWGRRPVAFCGGALFLSGCALAAHAPSFEVLLGARLLQGLGLAGSRISMHAIMRDRFVGDALARVLSYSAAVFLLVPLFAPSLGLWALQQTGTWRSVFYLQALIAICAFTWLAIRQPETRPTSRSTVQIETMLNNYLLIWKIPMARRYMLASCLALTPLMTYLALAPQLLQAQYQFGDDFPAVFAALSLPIGICSIANGLWVKRIGARSLLRMSLTISACCSLIFMPTVWWFEGQPPVFLMLGYLLITLASFGSITSNITSLAMEHLGQFAGAGSAMYGALATGSSALMASVIAGLYSNSPTPLVACSFACCLACLVITKKTKQHSH